MGTLWRTFLNLNIDFEPLVLGCIMTCMVDVLACWRSESHPLCFNPFWVPVTFTLIHSHLSLLLIWNHTQVDKVEMQSVLNQKCIKFFTHRWLLVLHLYIVLKGNMLKMSYVAPLANMCLLVYICLFELHAPYRVHSILCIKLLREFDRLSTSSITNGSRTNRKLKPRIMCYYRH